MSEVNGSIIFGLPEPAISSFSEASFDLGTEELELILNSANIRIDKVSELLSLDYAHDGLEKRGKYILIYPFDEGYMPLMRVLIQDGNGIEVYGGISHEYGASEYYVVTEGGTRFLGQVDEEGDEEGAPAEIISEFLRLIPRPIKRLFPDVFGI